MGGKGHCNLRCCVACRQVAPKDDLWRVVRLAGSGAVQLDQGMGRSAYLCPRADCLRQAQRKNRLGRALRVPVPQSIYGALADRLCSLESPQG